VFDEVYLRESAVGDTALLLSNNEGRWFPGMIDNIDCKDWEWKNFPFVWQ
jgi:hypothetical protein